MNTKHSSGQVLIEAIVAISIGVVGLLGFLQLLTQAVSINKDVGQKFVAVYLAAEGIEVVKSLIDENYAQGNAWGEDLDGGSYRVAYNSLTLITGGLREVLRYDSTSGLYSYAAEGVLTSFIRTIELINISTDGADSDNELKVVSVVEWTARGDTKEVTLEGHFFCWRPDVLCE